METVSTPGPHGTSHAACWRLLTPSVSSAARARACRSCHKPQHKWLSKDVHAQAMETLGEDASRPECVRCHATAKEYGPPPLSLDGYHSKGGVG